MGVFSSIEGFHNPERRHSRPDNLSPTAWEELLQERVTQSEVSA